ncbi:glycosyltransferase family 39 protein, partial [Candidatus Omnitrophota bacterium]
SLKSFPCAMYIHHAKNIAQGKDFSDTGYIFNPSNPIAPRSFPPVLPLLLAPIYALFGLNLTAMKIVVISFFLVSLYIMFLLFKDSLSSKYAYLLIALVGFHHYLWNFRNNILSDLPFLFFVFLSILLMYRRAQPHKSNIFLL